MCGRKETCCIDKGLSQQGPYLVLQGSSSGKLCIREEQETKHARLPKLYEDILSPMLCEKYPNIGILFGHNN